MSDPTAVQAATDGRGDGQDAQLGLSLSELLGEIWSPARRRSTGDEDDATPGERPDPDTGEPTTWSL